MRAEFIDSLHHVDADSWNRCLASDYPFLQHLFLVGLEDTLCTTRASGWQPHHCLIWDQDQLVAAAPTYFKSHSYGEYVFDWAFADAWQRSGLQYYPKLLTAVPFTPCSGPRLLVRPDVASPADIRERLVDGNLLERTFDIRFDMPVVKGLALAVNYVKESAPEVKELFYVAETSAPCSEVICHLY